ncbi:hypothetical protein CHCC20335_3519 [Bacillus paralicheniformis]|nr:hypothetical protein CHCC20335_3519 [Bacillus paralicheniformis]
MLKKSLKIYIVGTNQVECGGSDRMGSDFQIEKQNSHQLENP